MEKQYRSIEEIQADIQNPDNGLEKLTELEAELTEVTEMREAQNKAIEQAKREAEEVIEKRNTLIKKSLDGQGKVVVDFGKETKQMEQNEVRDLGITSAEYRSGWLKTQMGIALDENERRSVAMANAAVIPTMTVNKIFEKMVEYAPLLNEITLYRVNGPVKVPVAGTVNDAALHTENALMDAAADTWTEIALNSYEIAKLIRVSRSLANQAIDAFEGHIVDAIARKLAEKIEGYLIVGSGSSQPQGVQYARAWTDGSTGVDWASTKPTAAEILELAGYLNGGYHNKAKWLMNRKTFINDVYSLRDDAKYPLVRDVAGGYTIIGYPVIFSDLATDGEIFFGDFTQIVGNLSQDIRVERSDASGFVYNAIDFRGTCTFDSKVAITEAFVKGEATLA